MEDLIKDVATLTTIPEKSLVKLVDKSYWCISNEVIESLKQGDTVTEIDIGIGILYIKVIDDTIQYKFIPSAKLNDTVKDTVINKRNILEDTLEKTLVNKIVDTYKDLF